MLLLQYVCTVLYHHENLISKVLILFPNINIYEFLNIFWKCICMTHSEIVGK